MLTFEEACAKVLVRKVQPGQEIGVTPPDMEDAHQKFIPLHEQIQNSDEAMMLASFLMHMHQTQDIPILGLLCCAFSHGCAVGILMEKAEEV